MSCSDSSSSSCCPVSICKMGPVEYFSTLLRIFFGVWLSYVGLSKWIFMGSQAMIAYITGEFANTWVPVPLVTILAWVILIAEPVLGLWLVSGIKQRGAWTLTALLMFMLTFGKTITMDVATIANNWQYLLIALLGGALSGYGCCDEEGSCCDTGEKCCDSGEKKGGCCGA